MRIAGRQRRSHRPVLRPASDPDQSAAGSSIRDRQQAFSWTVRVERDRVQPDEPAARRAYAQRPLGERRFLQDARRARRSSGGSVARDDDRRGCAAPPAVLSYGFWQREYGGSPSAIGRTLTLDGHSFDIVGVTPPQFFGVEVGRAFDVAVPLCAEPFSRGAHSGLDKPDVWFLARWAG